MNAGSVSGGYTAHLGRASVTTAERYTAVAKIRAAMMAALGD